MTISRRLPFASRSALLALLSLACAAPSFFDPVTMDPPRAAPPAATLGLQFRSAGAHLNALLLVAGGSGPHPTLVLLHGFPGDERNLDLAQAIRRAGWNVVYFTYRGAWGSGGEFSFAAALADVAAVVASLREPSFAASSRVDPARIVLVGHSMGGALALISAARLAEVRCVASLAGASLDALAEAIDASEENARAMAESFQGWGEGRIRNVSGVAIVAELSEHRVEYASVSHAEQLARKPVLLVAGEQDEITPPARHHTPVAAAIRAQGGGMLRDVVLSGDHSFSDTRIALTRTLLGWLTDGCAQQLARP